MPTKTKSLKGPILILTALLISTTVWGQFDFRINPELSKKIDFTTDTIQQVQSIEKPSVVDSIFNLESGYDFQFRFWYSAMFTPSTSVFILTLRNKKWSARYFEPNNSWQKDGKQVRQIIIDQTKLDQLWELLVTNNVLTLPSQSVIQNRMIKYEIDTSNLGNNVVKRVEITDGALYNYQLVTPTGSRYYYYHCPQVLLKHYSNIQELYSATIIRLLIHKYLGVTDKGC